MSDKNLSTNIIHLCMTDQAPPTLSDQPEQDSSVSSPPESEPPQISSDLPEEETPVDSPPDNPSNLLVPLLGEVSAPHIVDNSIAGQTIYPFHVDVNDISAFESYLQNNVSSFTRLYYYPLLPLLQIQTLEDNDTETLDNLVNTYLSSNPSPDLTVTEILGMAPAQVSCNSWKTIFVFSLSNPQTKTLVRCVVSAAVMSSAETIGSSVQLRIVNVAENKILGTAIGNDTAYKDIIIPISNSPNQLASLEFQANTNGTFVSIHQFSTVTLPNT